MATESQLDGELRYAEIAEITMDEEFTPRAAIDEAALAELTASIRRRGILQPLLARSDGDGTLRLVAGHRRLAAARAAGLERVRPVCPDLRLSGRARSAGARTPRAPLGGSWIRSSRDEVSLSVHSVSLENAGRDVGGLGRFRRSSSRHLFRAASLGAPSGS
jgi:hypothetical protein